MPRRCLQYCLTLGPLLLLVARAAAAQDPWGNVRGSVVASGGIPVRGARVALAGTAFAATTDNSGRYFLHHVPAGVYDVTATSGDGPVGDWPDVRVTSGGTTTLDLRLGSASVEPRTDDMTSRAIITGTQLGALPVDDPRQGLTLVPGVVLRGTAMGISAVPQLSIRGTPASQTSSYVDGAPTQFGTLGTPALLLGANGISEVSVTTGLNSAETADARGASIAYVTPMGGTRVRGTFHAGSDEPFSHDVSVGYNRFDGSLGGPLGVLARGSWFVAASVQGQRSAYRGAGAEDIASYVPGAADTTVTYATGSGAAATIVVPTYIQYGGTCGGTGNGTTTIGRAIQDNYGIACQGVRRPMDWTTTRRGVTKLAFSYGAGSSVTLSGVASDRQDRFDPGTLIGDPAAYQGAHTSSVLGVLNWAQRLSGSLTLAVHGSIADDRARSGPLDGTSELATRDPGLGMEFSPLRFAGMDSLPFPVTDAIIRHVRTNTGFRLPFLNRTDLRVAQPFRLNPYGTATGWPTVGLDGAMLLASEHRAEARWQLDWDGGPATVSVGADFSRISATLYDAPSVINDLNLNTFLVEPRRTGAFAQVRLDGTEMTFELGLRVDRFDPGGDFPTVPGRIFTRPDIPAAADSLAQEDSLVAHAFTPRQMRTVVSPRVRWAVRVAPDLLIHVSAGQQAEAPPIGQQFSRVNSDLSFTDNRLVFGRDVDVVKTTMLETGFIADVSTGVALRGALYSKTNALPYLSTVEQILDPLQGRTQNFFVMGTSGYNGSGADAMLDWHSDHWEGRAGWSFGRVTYTPDGQFPSFTLTSSQHALFAAATLRGLAGADVSALLRLNSGASYTKLQNTGNGVLASQGFGLGSTAIEPLNASSTPWTKTLDLHISKQLSDRLGHWTIYAEVLNVLNTTNLLDVFAETGSDTDSLFKDHVIAPEIFRLESAAGTALGADNAVNLAVACAGAGTSISRVDCATLARVENRFGNGDGSLTPVEYRRALSAYYDLLYGPWTLHGPGRTARIGLTIRF